MRSNFSCARLSFWSLMSSRRPLYWASPFFRVLSWRELWPGPGLRDSASALAALYESRGARGVFVLAACPSHCPAARARFGGKRLPPRGSAPHSPNRQKRPTGRKVRRSRLLQRSCLKPNPPDRNTKGTKPRALLDLDLLVQQRELLVPADELRAEDVALARDGLRGGGAG